MSMPDPAARGEEMEKFARDLRQKAERYTQLQTRMDETSVTETSPRGDVTVTVDSNGGLTNLQLSEQTRGMEPPAVAAAVMSTLRRAQAKLRDRVTALIHESVGEDIAGENIAATYARRFPDPPEDEQDADAAQEELAIGRLEDDQPQAEPPRRPQRPRRDDGDDDFGAGGILR